MSEVHRLALVSAMLASGIMGMVCLYRREPRASAAFYAMWLLGLFVAMLS